MTPEQLAVLHAAAFVTERAWSADEFTELLANPFTQLFPAQQGFALTRTVAGESELLTLAVHPDHQRQGIGRQLLHDWLTSLGDDAQTAFLEVAADNTGAIALYTTFGFVQTGHRRAYYARKNSAPADALILSHDITSGQGDLDAAIPHKSG